MLTTSASLVSMAHLSGGDVCRDISLEQNKLKQKQDLAIVFLTNSI